MSPQAWGALGLIALVVAFVAGHLLFLRHSARLGNYEPKPGDPPLEPRWRDEPDDWPARPPPREPPP